VDVRETLGMRWIDSAIAEAAQYPMFFTAAWSAIRPNVGPTFLASAKVVRDLAAAAAEAGAPPDHAEWIRLARLQADEVAEVARVLRAFHENQAKAALVVHALARAARGRPAGGSGIEEPPPKRGVPAWQPHARLELPGEGDEAAEALAAAAKRLGAPRPPDALLALRPWPGYLTRAWRAGRRFTASDTFSKASGRIRRAIVEGVRRLPHVISLQWGALRDRGFSEEDRAAVGDALALYDAAMPGTLALVAYLWVAAGSPKGSRG